ncbi:hypothetical protein OF83DRAFT_1080341 [Amylostereum chailletii]|nr:hypothetical protein OF83DRAFT_1080341 [Amylostereum chailletii]
MSLNRRVLVEGTGATDYWNNPDRYSSGGERRTRRFLQIFLFKHMGQAVVWSRLFRISSPPTDLLDNVLSIFVPQAFQLGVSVSHRLRYIGPSPQRKSKKYSTTVLARRKIFEIRSRLTTSRRPCRASYPSYQPSRQGFTTRRSIINLWPQRRNEHHCRRGANYHATAKTCSTPGFGQLLQPIPSWLDPGSKLSGFSKHERVDDAQAPTNPRSYFSQSSHFRPLRSISGSYTTQDAGLGLNHAGAPQLHPSALNLL